MVCVKIGVFIRQINKEKEFFDMNENINKKFDVKNFDYDKCYEEVKENA